MSLCQSGLVIEQLAKVSLGVSRSTGSYFKTTKGKQTLGMTRLMFKQAPVVVACTIHVSTPRSRHCRPEYLIGRFHHLIPVARSLDVTDCLENR
jgi:hypothetical protein